MSKARQLANIGNVVNDGAVLQTNLIINGAMNVAQRSSSAVSVSNGSNEGYQTLDRFAFQYGNAAGGVANISQDTTVPSGYGFSNSYKVDVTTADTSLATNHQIYIEHKVEAQDMRNSGWNYTDPNSYITCSFWARSVKAGTYCFALQAPDSASQRIFVKEFDLVANTWKRIIVKISGEAGLAFNNDNGVGAHLTWSLQAEAGRATATDDTWNSADSSRATSNQVNFFDSTSNDFYLTGVTLTVGDTAPETYPHRSYGDEFQRCLRYYQYFEYNGYQGFPVTFRGSNSPSIGGSPLVYLPRMRADPTVSLDRTLNLKLYRMTDGASVTLSSGMNASAQHRSTYGPLELRVGGTADSGVSNGVGYSAIATNSGYAKFKIDAEL